MFKFICYPLLRPTLSSVRGEHILVHPLCAWFVPRRDILLRVCAVEPLLVIWLAPLRRARGGRVAFFHIEATSETNIPVGVLLCGV